MLLQNSNVNFSWLWGFNWLKLWLLTLYIWMFDRRDAITSSPMTSLRRAWKNRWTGFFNRFIESNRPKEPVRGKESNFPSLIHIDIQWVVRVFRLQAWDFCLPVWCSKMTEGETFINLSFQFYAGFIVTHDVDSTVLGIFSESKMFKSVSSPSTNSPECVTSPSSFKIGLESGLESESKFEYPNSSVCC